MFDHVPAPARRLVIEWARAIRAGAKVRTQCGDSIGDNAYCDYIFDESRELSREIKYQTGMHVPAKAVRPFLWRAASVGESYA